MISRLHLAALHFNENSDRPQACTQAGPKRYLLSKLKYSKGSATVKAIKEPLRFTYATGLMVEAAKLGSEVSKRKRRKGAPPTLPSRFQYPPKDEVVSSHTSRFNLKSGHGCQHSN